MKKITGTSNLIRPKFAAGMLLQHEDLELLNEYTRNLSRLMFGSLFGCGVVCGLEVGLPDASGEIRIDCGLAIAPSGSPIWVPKSEPLKIGLDCEKVNEWWVVLCPKSKFCHPRTAMSSCGDDETPNVYTREVEGYEIRLEDKPPPCACGCLTEAGKPMPRNGEFQSECRCVEPGSDCYKDHYAATCTCCSDDDRECDCVFLAHIAWDRDKKVWTVDPTGRRLTRPVLMSDPATKRSTQLPSPAAIQENTAVTADDTAAEVVQATEA